MATTSKPKAAEPAKPPVATTEKEKADGRAMVEAAMTQLRDAVSAFPDRLREYAPDWETAFEKFGDDALREIGRLAIRAQRTPAALTDLSSEIRKRKSELAAKAGEPPKPAA